MLVFLLLYAVYQPSSTLASPAEHAQEQIASCRKHSAYSRYRTSPNDPPTATGADLRPQQNLQGDLAAMYTVATLDPRNMSLYHSSATFHIYATASLNQTEPEIPRYGGLDEGLLRNSVSLQLWTKCKSYPCAQ